MDFLGDHLSRFVLAYALVDDVGEDADHAGFLPLEAVRVDSPLPVESMRDVIDQAFVVLYVGLVAGDADEQRR